MKHTKSKENAQRAERIIEAGLEALHKTLEQGQSDGVKEHLAAMARFSRYSFSNMLLIFGQRPDATHIDGFRGWQKRGRQVLKGEKGILIRAPMVIRKDTRGSDEPRDRFVGFRAAYVFDISQTEGEPIAALGTACGTPGEHLPALKEFAAAKQIQISIEPQLDCVGKSRGGEIVLRAGLEVAEEFSTLVHEIAHELLHQNDAARELSEVVRETEAEAVAQVVCYASGIDSLQASADYIQLYQGDAEMLRGSLVRIKSASAEIISALGSTSCLDTAA